MLTTQLGEVSKGIVAEYTFAHAGLPCSCVLGFKCEGELTMGLIAQAFSEAYAHAHTLRESGVKSLTMVVRMPGFPGMADDVTRF